MADDTKQDTQDQHQNDADKTSQAGTHEGGASDEQRKALEVEIEGLADELAEDVPEQFRALIPDLPPVEKVKWLRRAIKSGVFTEKRQEDGPGSKRPTSKRGEDLFGLTPYQMLAMGYGR